MSNKGYCTLDRIEAKVLGYDLFNGKHASVNGQDYNVEVKAVKKHFMNSFAETVFELDDGTKLYVNANADSVEIWTPRKEEK